jgi:hypothetical protein
MNATDWTYHETEHGRKMAILERLQHENGTEFVVPPACKGDV